MCLMAVVMVLRPKTAPNEPRRGNCGLRAFLVSPYRRGIRVREVKISFVLLSRARAYVPGVVVLGSRPLAVPKGPWKARLGCRARFALIPPHKRRHYRQRSRIFALQARVLAQREEYWFSCVVTVVSNSFVFVLPFISRLRL